MKKYISIIALSLVGLAGCQSNTKPTDNIQTIEVAPALVDCVGVGPMKCMEIKREGSSQWELMYNSIDGFNFESGNKYKLKVRVEERKNPPMDASSQKWSLVEIISKTKK